MVKSHWRQNKTKDKGSLAAQNIAVWFTYYICRKEYSTKCIVGIQQLNVQLMYLSQSNLDILHYSIQGLQPGIIPGLIYNQSITAAWNSAYFTLMFFYVQFHSSTAITITTLSQDYHSKIWGILPVSFLWLCNLSPSNLFSPLFPKLLNPNPPPWHWIFLESKNPGFLSGLVSQLSKGNIFF